MIRATGRPCSLMSGDSPALTRSSTFAVCRFSSLTATVAMTFIVPPSSTRGLSLVGGSP